tara:strand:- start:167 stop:418 length:252 start_codon:yes stop_codon:yes gene_type:complete
MLAKVFAASKVALFTASCISWLVALDGTIIKPCFIGVFKYQSGAPLMIDFDASGDKSELFDPQLKVKIEKNIKDKILNTILSP